MEIKGRIIYIKYQNDLNSYTVAKFEPENLIEDLTVVGYLPFVEEGDTLKLIGKMVIHQEYGEQFKIDTFEKLIPKDAKSLEKYLGSRDYKRDRTGNRQKNHKKIWRRYDKYF